MLFSHPLITSSVISVFLVVLSAAIIGLAVLDDITTLAVLKKGGIELDPIFKWLQAIKFSGPLKFLQPVAPYTWRGVRVGEALPLIWLAWHVHTAWAVVFLIAVVVIWGATVVSNARIAWPPHGSK
jgi:hypothetical protein